MCGTQRCACVYCAVQVIALEIIVVTVVSSLPAHDSNKFFLCVEEWTFFFFAFKASPFWEASVTAGPVSGVSRRGGEVGGLPCGRNSIAGLSACPATAPGPGSGQHPARTRTRRRRRSPSREPGGRREGMARLLPRLIPVVSLVAVLISCPPHEGGRVCVMRSHTHQQPHRTAVCRGPAGCQRPAQLRPDAVGAGWS